MRIALKAECSVCTCIHSTQLPLVPHMCVNELGQHWLRLWLVAWWAPSHYLNQYRNIVNWALTNKLQWNFKQNIKLFIRENPSENIVCEMAAILSREYIQLQPYKGCLCVQPTHNDVMLTCLLMICKQRSDYQVRISRVISRKTPGKDINIAYK